jgi:hypothetical protein
LAAKFGIGAVVVLAGAGVFGLSGGAIEAQTVRVYRSQSVERPRFNPHLTMVDRSSHRRTDAEDKTDKHPVTPGPLAPARELVRGDAARPRHGAGSSARSRRPEKEPNRLAAYVGVAQAAKKGAVAKTKQYRQNPAPTRDADTKRPEVSELKNRTASAAGVR